MDQAIARAVATRGSSRPRAWSHARASRRPSAASGQAGIAHRHLRIRSVDATARVDHGNICGNFRACDMMPRVGFDDPALAAVSGTHDPAVRLHCAAVSSIPLFGCRASSRNAAATTSPTGSSVEMSAAFAAGPAVLRSAMAHPRCVSLPRFGDLAERHG
jgi:hypothetical protein